MGSQVTLPLWVVIIVALLAALGGVDRILVPSVRWALRRRANRAIDELNTRLKLRIQPFKLTKRQVLIDRLAFDPEVLHAADEYARESGVPREVAMEKVKRYAEEIVPSFSAYAYFRIGTRIARSISQMLYRVRIGYRNDEALAAVDPASSVIFVINHRSNMDYVLVTYVAATSSALSYAVGEWAQVWGLRGLIRSMGAYFISRDSREALYRKVLARYVHMATPAGVTQAIFPEGGLSRDGKLRPPKFGLLSYMVAGFDPQGPRDVVFVPVAVNYDRVLEDRMLTVSRQYRAGQEAGVRIQRQRSSRATSSAMSGWRCAANGIASAIPASVSASRCRCENMSPSEDRFSPAGARSAACRNRKARQQTDAGGGARRAGAAGLAGLDRDAGGRRKPALAARHQAARLRA